jgi:Ca-activated chloride channel family protein
MWWLLLALAESLPPLLLGVIVFILAGPQKYGAPEAKRKMSNIQFCVDVSGSMTAPFGEGTRYDGAMKAIEKFVDARTGDSFGLTFFGHNFIHWCPLTADPSAIKYSLPFMRPEVAPYWFGGTNIPKALNGCKQVLIQRQEGQRMILLVTDGFDSDLDIAAPELVRDFKAHEITVFGIIVGFHSIQDGMAQVTRGTGGEVFTVDDPEALRTVFAQIDRMKQVEMEKTIAEPMDNYRPWVIAASVIAGLWTLTALGLRYTPW